MPTTTNTATPVLELEQLTTRYGDHVAVDHLTVAVPPGVVAGFIGPNGAGKTTTMAMLLGLVRPSSGHASVLGESIAHPDRYLGRVGALVEGPALWPGLTGIENLRVIARLNGQDERHFDDVLDQVGLAGRGGDRFGTYSYGMKQRLAIAAALLGEPRLLVLDEPTNGLDPIGITEMRDLVRSLTRADRTILVSSHILSELEQVCDWLLVIDHGRLVYAGETTGFSSRANPEIVLGARTLDDLQPLTAVARAYGVESAPDHGVLVVEPAGRDPEELAELLNRRAAAAGIVLSELHVRRPTLESSYLQLLEGDLR
jgi:ABC-2 type transport system ATP-binding protein